MNTKNGMCILELRSLYEYTISLLFHEEKKLFHIPVGAFKLCPCAALDEPCKIMYEIICSQWMDEGIDWPWKKILLCLLMLRLL